MPNPAFDGHKYGAKKCHFPGTRTREEAWLECYNWLMRAEAAGILGAPAG